MPSRRALISPKLGKRKEHLFVTMCYMTPMAETATGRLEKANTAIAAALAKANQIPLFSQTQAELAAAVCQLPALQAHAQALQGDIKVGLVGGNPIHIGRLRCRPGATHGTMIILASMLSAALTRTRTV